MTALSHSPFLYALGWAIANSLWQMALLWLVYQLFFGISKRNRPTARHLAATTLLFTGFIWFIISFVTRFNELRSVQKWLVSLPAIEEPAQNIQVNFFQNTINWEAIVSGIEKWLPYLSAAYLVILIMLSVRLLNAFAYSQRLRTDSLFLINEHWQKFVQELVQRLEIGKDVKIYLSGLIDVPATMGFIKPVILLPLATINHLSVSQVEAVILHEMAHIRRHDYLVNLLIAVVETILFFNPFTQLLSGNLKKEREMCCDDFVVRFQHDPHNYAAALLSLEKMRVGNSSRLAMAATGSKDQLLSRVRRILNIKSQNLNYGQKLLALLIVAGFISSVAWFSPVPVKKQPLSQEEKLAWSVNQLLQDTHEQDKIFVVKQRNKKDSIINLAKNKRKIQYQADHMYMKSGFAGDTVVFDGNVNWDFFPERIPESLEEKALIIAPSLSPEHTLTPGYNELHESPQIYYNSPPAADLYGTLRLAPKMHIPTENFVLSNNEDFQLAFKHAELNKMKRDLEKLESELNSDVWKKLEQEAKAAGKSFEWEKAEKAIRQEMINVWKEVEESHKKQEAENDKQFGNNYFFHLKNYADFRSGDMTKARRDSAIRKIIRKVPVTTQKNRTTAKLMQQSWQLLSETAHQKNAEHSEQRKRKSTTKEIEKFEPFKAEEAITFRFDELTGFDSTNTEMFNNVFAIAQSNPRLKVAGITSLKKPTGKSRTKCKTVIRIITDKDSYDIELRDDEPDEDDDNN